MSAPTLPHKRRGEATKSAPTQRRQQKRPQWQAARSARWKGRHAGRSGSSAAVQPAELPEGLWPSGRDLPSRPFPGLPCACSGQLGPMTAVMLSSRILCHFDLKISRHQLPMPPRLAFAQRATKTAKPPSHDRGAGVARERGATKLFPSSPGSTSGFCGLTDQWFHR